MKCYIVAVGEELGVFSYDYKYHVFITKRKAQSYFKKSCS